MIISGQPFFWISKIKDPFFGKKIKNVPKCGVVALFMRDFFNLYIKKVWSCRVWSFFPFLKILKNDPFMKKKTKTSLFEFRGYGHNSTSIYSVDQCCIFLKASFLMRIFRRDASDNPNNNFFFSVRFVFLPKKGSLISKWKKNRLTR